MRLTCVSRSQTWLIWHSSYFSPWCYGLPYYHCSLETWQGDPDSFITPPPSETPPLDGPLDLLTPRNISYTPESTTGSAFIALLPLKPPLNKTTPIFSIKYDAGLAKTEYLLSLTPISLIRPHCRLIDAINLLHSALYDGVFKLVLISRFSESLFWFLFTYSLIFWVRIIVI